MTKPVRKTKAQVAPVEVVAVASAPVYQLNAKATELAKLGDQAGQTLQTPAKGLGLAWRSAGHKAPNTRASALAAIQAAYPTGCTFAQAVAALQAAKLAGLNLGSGTPNSYVKAFVANGYLAA